MGLLKCIREPIFQLNSDDIVVFVVGPSGSGKSQFVEEVTKSGLIKVGDGLPPCTTKVQAVRCVLAEEGRAALRAPKQTNIVFVDTPSFHTGEDDKPEKEMNSWLSKSRCKSTLVGTIYMHRIETDPAYEPIQRHLNSFAYAFPRDFASFPWRLHAVLSHEGVVPEDKTARRRAVFEAQLDVLDLGGKQRWHTSCHPGFFQPGDTETAWQAVVSLFAIDAHGGNREA